jgi:ubiquinone/menaquinone biosynthesis C-methylase UbiE
VEPPLERAGTTLNYHLPRVTNALDPREGDFLASSNRNGVAFHINHHSPEDSQNSDVLGFHRFEHQVWERSAEAYAGYFGRLTGATATDLLDAVQAEKGTRLLDLATGPGIVAAAAQRRGCDVVAIDFSESMVKLAKSSQSKNIQFEVGDVQDLSYSEASFDCAVMNFGILHLSVPERAIGQVWKILKPGGRFGFTAWAQPGAGTGFDIVRRAVELNGDPNVSMPEGPPFSAFSDPDYAKRVLIASGFIDITSQTLPLNWTLKSPEEDLYTALYEGSARLGELLRRQSPDARSAIRSAVLQSCSSYICHGLLQIPMSAVLYRASKPQS